MRSSHAIGATATLLAVLAASGCGGGSTDGASSSGSTHSKPGIASGEPAPPQTTKSTSPSSAANSPTTKAKPTSSGTAAGAPGVPEPARQHTKAGAIAFARHYVDLVNGTAVRPKVGVLEPLALSSCKTCDNHETTVRELLRDKQRFSGPEVSVRRLSIVGDSEVATFVEVHGYEPKADIIDSTGKSVQSFPEVKDVGQVFTLRWTSHGWRVAKLQTVD